MCFLSELNHLTDLGLSQMFIYFHWNRVEYKSAYTYQNAFSGLKF